MIRPRNVHVREGQYANFSCEVPCSSDVFWFVGDLFNSTPLQFGLSNDVIMVTRDQSGCSLSDTKFDNISILATADLDHMAVQCSVVDAPGCESVLYSRFRILKGLFVFLVS